MKKVNQLDQNYLELVNDILKNGILSGDRTGTGTKKVFGRMLRHNMTAGFPLLTSKFVHTSGIIHELIWFLSGNTNIKYLVDRNVNIWVGDCYKKYKEYCSKMEEPETEYLIDDSNTGSLRIMTEKEFIDNIKAAPVNHKAYVNVWKFSSSESALSHFTNKFAELGIVYGKEWVDWNGINQIQKAIDTLKNNPNSRRILITAWNPEHIEAAVLPPCHYSFQLQACELTFEERKKLYPENTPNLLSDADLDAINTPKHSLSLLVNVRSWDVPLGGPYNIASYGLLLEMFAQQTNMIANDLIIVSGDTHVYLNQTENINIQMNNPTFKLPTLKLNKKDSIFDYRIEDIEILNYHHAGKVQYALSN